MRIELSNLLFFNVIFVLTFDIKVRANNQNNLTTQEQNMYIRCQKTKTFCII